jgi:hypothetical protein
MKNIVINIGALILAIILHYLFNILIVNGNSNASLTLKLIMDIPGIQFGSMIERWSIIAKNIFILFIFFRWLIVFIVDLIFIDKY